MKTVVLVGESLTDDPVAELGSRTPLEFAKTPALQALAKKGVVASAVFTSHELSLSGDVALMAILGFNPEKYYTGPAPLEYAAAGFAQQDNEIVFRCDFVTISDGTLADVRAGLISSKESLTLVEELNKKLSSPQIRFFAAGSYKNLLLIRDAEKVELLDELECLPPTQALGQKFVKALPKGEGAQMLIDLMEQSKTILEGHEINRVRIDLKENPASMIWPWGHGRRPKLEPFNKRFQVEGAVYSKAEFARGLGICAGFQAAPDLNSALEAELALVYVSADELAPESDPLKSKVRFIEYFDGVAQKILDACGTKGDTRFLICTDVAGSSAKKSALHGPVPVLMAGRGVEHEENAGFNEKSASQSRLQFKEGWKIMEHFLK